ncbi:MAG: hypothetical protein JWM71_1330 [Solirubrobacteraceae bacterium]|nr:hypothetical protein [Solirubrobacteraceae bacterium]
MTDARRERIALNESRFRDLNESLSANVHGALDGERPGFICECAISECMEVVGLPRGKYEEVRSDARHFLVAPGHELLDAEYVIERGDGYVVVEKHPDVAPIVEERDPRA